MVNMPKYQLQEEIENNFVIQKELFICSVPGMCVQTHTHTE